MGYSVGIGLTNDCNLDCAHCYRETDAVYNLRLAQVQQICESLPVDAMGMGTGENLLNPEFAPIVRYLQRRGVKLSIASNGYSLTEIDEGLLRAFHDAEVSIDFPTAAAQDAFRGPGNWALVHQAIKRCQRLGVEVSILATMMSANYDQMGDLVALARRNGVNLRVNVYQPVKSDAFRLGYDQFWDGFRRLLAAGDLVSCTEPVVRAALGLAEVRSPCGHQSIRFDPRGQIIPCVYWPADSAGPHIEDLARLGDRVLESDAFRRARAIPPSAADCPCQGGCASRRALNGQLDAHDDYCPWVRGETVTLDWRPAPAKALMRSGNVCTTIVV